MIGALARLGRRQPAGALTEASLAMARPATVNLPSPSRWWFDLLRATFTLMVIAPTIATAAYTLLLASPQYTSETRLAVRGGLRGVVLETEPKPAAKVDEAMQRPDEPAVRIAAEDHEQDPYILVNYVRSLALVARLDQDGWLRALFRKPGIDWLSRLEKDASIEDLWRFWTKHVVAAVDRRTSLVVLRVRAFSPEDAQEIARRILAESEVLLNALNEQSRNDTLRDARRDLGDAEARYAAALAQQQEWRLKQVAVDPVQVAETLSLSLLKLESERVVAQQEIEVLRRLQAPSAPGANILADRVRALDAGIDDLRRKLGRSSDDLKSAIAALGAFEETELEKRFSETLVSVTTKGLREAERRAQAKAIFLSVFVPPSQPASPSDPIWWRLTFFVFIMTGIVWTNLMTLIAVIRDKRR